MPRVSPLPRAVQVQVLVIIERGLLEVHNRHVHGRWIERRLLTGSNFRFSHYQSGRYRTWLLYSPSKLQVAISIKSAIASPIGISWADFEYPLHLSARLHATIGMLRHCRYVMCQEDSAFARGPLKDFGISFAEQADILDTNDIERWQEPKQAADNAVVEIFVRRKTKHF
jgi:hypothetical protein